MAPSQKKNTNEQVFHPAGKNQRSGQDHAANSYPQQKINNVQTGEDYEDTMPVADRDRIFYRSNIDDWQG